MGFLHTFYSFLKVPAVWAGHQAEHFCSKGFTFLWGSQLGAATLQLGLRCWLMAENQSAVQETKIDPWVGKMPWRREWQPTPVFLPGESHGQRNLASYSRRGLKESDTIEAANTFTLLTNSTSNLRGEKWSHCNFKWDWAYEYVSESEFTPLLWTDGFNYIEIIVQIKWRDPHEVPPIDLDA